jgi:methyl-accepting chemotaxis protein
MRATFDRLLARMSESVDRAREAGERMRQVTAAVGKIETVLAEVEDIALSTRLLTINAKIQASHAGVHGRGFVVIAEAISELSGKSDAIVGQVRENLAGVTGAVQGAGTVLTQLGDSGGQAVQESQGELHGALDLVARVHGETQAGLERATRSGDELAQEIHRAVTAMQFQDRVSQRIEHLLTALQGMSAGLGECRAGRACEPRDHLAALERSYTMAEEHTGPVQGGTNEVVLF